MGRERAKGAGDVMNRDHDKGPAAGEAVARAELDDAMAAYYDDLIAVVRRRGAEPWQATEIVHDLYVRLSGKPEALAGKSSIRAFLIRAAINLGVDRGRRRSFENRLFAMLDLRLEPADGAGRDEPAAATAIDAPRRVGALRDAIMELPPQRRSAFIASVVAGMDKDEIAERLGVTRGMVNRHLRKALAHCMDRMEEFDRG